MPPPARSPPQGRGPKPEGLRFLCSIHSLKFFPSPFRACELHLFLMFCLCLFGFSPCVLPARISPVHVFSVPCFWCSAIYPTPLDSALRTFGTLKADASTQVGTGEQKGPTVRGKALGEGRGNLPVHTNSTVDINLSKHNRLVFYFPHPEQTDSLFGTESGFIQSSRLHIT